MRASIRKGERTRVVIVGCGLGGKAAVAEISRWKFGGLTAWLLWFVMHLRSILGVKNKFFVLLNWLWNYVNYKQSLRLILRAGK